MVSESALTCTDLEKNFHLGRTELAIIRGLSACFHHGQLTTIQGASGSGKSTLLQMLGGLEKPDAGEVSWARRSLYKLTRDELARWRNRTVGFVFQSYHLFPELSALENVEFPARLGRRGNPEIGAELLAQVGLSDRRFHRPAELSGGEQQRVALARALRCNPALVLADEPTGNLDAATGHEIIDLLVGLQAERQVCLIIVTHDDSIAALGQQRLRLEKGRLMESGE